MQLTKQRLQQTIQQPRKDGFLPPPPPAKRIATDEGWAMFDAGTLYPESDGKPMAENTTQFQYLVTIEGNLESLFAERPDVFVCGDLLWYPTRGENQTRLAPDVMVIFGRPKGHRGSYLQWQEENVAPQVVFEILSPSNRKQEMDEKFAFYERYGVEEYYIYDPARGRLQGWLREEHSRLEPIARMIGWQSPRLGVRFLLSGYHLQLEHPDGSRFLSFVELSKRIEEVEDRALSELLARADVEEALVKSEQGRFDAEQARLDAEQQVQIEVNARAQAEARLHELEAKLREAGLL